MKMGFEWARFDKLKIPDAPICFRSAAMLLAYILLTAPPVLWFWWISEHEGLHHGLLE